MQYRKLICQGYRHKEYFPGINSSLICKQQILLTFYVWKCWLLLFNFITTTAFSMGRWSITLFKVSGSIGPHLLFLRKMDSFVLLTIVLLSPLSSIKSQPLVVNEYFINWKQEIVRLNSLTPDLYVDWRPLKSNYKTHLFFK